MRILLVQPKLDPRVASLGRLEPLSLEILAGALPHHDVRIFDARLEGSLVQGLADFQPDIVGVTAMTVEYAEAVRVTRVVKEFSATIPVVVGGNHATLSPADYYLPTVDAIVLGLGHHTLREMVEALEVGNDWTAIPGLALPTDDGWQKTPQRDATAGFQDIPRPNRDLTRKYVNNYRPSLRFGKAGVVISSLGCPARCVFCSSWVQNCGRYLERDAESLVDEIASMPQKAILLADDNSLHNVDRAWEICRLLKARNIRKQIVAYCRADTIAANPELIKSLAEAGIEGMVVGYEAVSDERLKALKKGTTVEVNRTAIRVLREAGIRNAAMFVVSPEFTPTDFAELREFVQRERLWTPRFTVMTPEPGTPYFKTNRNNVLIQPTEDSVYYDFTHCVLPTRLDYMTFFDEYQRLYRTTFSVRRYLREFYSEFVEFIKSGTWPKTERRIFPFSHLLLAKWRIFSTYRKMKRDYESLAPANRRPRPAAPPQPPVPAVDSSPPQIVALNSAH